MREATQMSVLPIPYLTKHDTSHLPFWLQALLFFHCSQAFVLKGLFPSPPALLSPTRALRRGNIFSLFPIL